MTDSFRTMRRLTLALLVSGSLNIVMAAFFIYWMVKDRPPTPYCESKPAKLYEQQAPLALDRSSSEVLRRFRSLSMEQLVSKLSNTQLVENGYTQRDLALASLVAFHRFDLPRALIGLPQPRQQRSLVYGKRQSGAPAEVTVYPDLTDAQYASIVRFAQTERWPLTSQGLFSLLQRPDNADKSLTEAFYLTPEFLSVEMLFNRAEAHVSKAELLKVLSQGNWKILSTFSEQQRAVLDVSEARRQRFLLDYIENNSAAAAYLMMKTDALFAAKKLDDHHALTMLKLMESRTPESEQFALSLLTSPRRDDVWEAAAERLYDYAGEAKPDTFRHRTVLARFVPIKQRSGNAVGKKNLVATLPVPSAPPRIALPIEQEKIYVIQEGDSLWKISRRFKVDIDAVKKANKMESDTLKLGATLKIPS